MFPADYVSTYKKIGQLLLRIIEIYATLRNNNTIFSELPALIFRYLEITSVICMKKDNKRKNNVQSVDRALRLLNVLGRHQASMTLTELYNATSLDTSISTAYRLMSTLLDREYVSQNPETKKYSLGPQLLNIGSIALKQLDLDYIPIDYLKELGDLLNEHVNITKLVGNRAVYINQIQAEQRSIKLFTQIGASVPLYCTGVGKSILAYLPEHKKNQVLDCEPLESNTVNTITNVHQLNEELEQIREQGYAVDNEEMEIGVRCVAAPIFKLGGDVIGAISISGPKGRILPERDKEISGHVKKTAQKISNHLGYQGSKLEA